MNASDLQNIIEQLVGTAPDGLEWMSYMFSWLLLFFGLGSVLAIIFKVLHLFDKS